MKFNKVARLSPNVGTFVVAYMYILSTRSDLHLRESERIVIALPVKPCDALFSLARSSQVEAVQVGTIAGLVPPPSFV